MAKTASNIVDRALTLIDEVPTSFATAATTETSIRQQALQILPEVCRDLVKELPLELKKYLEESATMSLVVANGKGVKWKAVYSLPDDYWELVSIKLSVWEKNVTEYIFIDSESYGKQNNPFTRAGKQNPVVAINSGSAYGLSNSVIECFSINEGDATTISKFTYIKFTNVPDDVGNTWPDELFDEITKALATELHIIKSRLEEAIIKGEEVTNAIEQHE
jgi:hypothetical protein